MSCQTQYDVPINYANEIRNYDTYCINWQFVTHGHTCLCAAQVIFLQQSKVANFYVNTFDKALKTRGLHSSPRHKIPIIRKRL